VPLTEAIKRVSSEAWLPTVSQRRGIVFKYWSICHISSYKSHFVVFTYVWGLWWCYF